MNNKVITISRKNGAYAIKTDSRLDLFYDARAEFELIFPRIPREGECITYEVKERA